MTLNLTNRCLLKTEEVEGYELVEREVPECGPNDVVIKVEKVGICGSDVLLWKWGDAAKAIASVPFIPGHEATGEVIAKGSYVTNIEIGQKVAVENHFYCGECTVCKIDNRPDICQRMNQYGHGNGTDQGGCSQYSVVPGIYCYPLTRPLTSTQAVLLEPMGVAYNAVSQVEVGGNSVLVLGAGPIGLFAVAICKALSASRIICVDISQEKLDLAVKMGADEIINSGRRNIGKKVMKLTSGDGVDRIIEATGSVSLINNCFSWLKKGGQLAMIGLPKDSLQIDDPITRIIQKSLTLKTVHGRRIFSTWRACEALIASGRVDVSGIVSHEFPMSSYKDAFETLLSGNACKIVLNPHE